jgi:hypothetical protein
MSIGYELKECEWQWSWPNLNTQISVLWNLTPCSLLETYRYSQIACGKDEKGVQNLSGYLKKRCCE